MPAYMIPMDMRSDRFYQSVRKLHDLVIDIAYPKTGIY